jgi:hypothetical protein
MITQGFILYVLFIDVTLLRYNHTSKGEIYIITDHMQLTDYNENMQLPREGL